MCASPLERRPLGAFAAFPFGAFGGFGQDFGAPNRGDVSTDDVPFDIEQEDGLLPPPDALRSSASARLVPGGFFVSERRERAAEAPGQSFFSQGPRPQPSPGRVVAREQQAASLAAAQAAHRRRQGEAASVFWSPPSPAKVVCERAHSFAVSVESPRPQAASPMRLGSSDCMPCRPSFGQASASLRRESAFGAWRPR